MCALKEQSSCEQDRQPPAAGKEETENWVKEAAACCYTFMFIAKTGSQSAAWAGLELTLQHGS